MGCLMHKLFRNAANIHTSSTKPPFGSLGKEKKKKVNASGSVTSCNWVTWRIRLFMQLVKKF